MDANENKLRYYYMDSMRSTLMCAVVLFHIGSVYMFGSKWIVVDPNSKSHLFNMFNEIMPLFRMPGFFMISGFFTLFSLKKYGAAGFIKMRMARVIVPLFFTGITLNTIQEYFRYSCIENNCCSFSWYMQNEFINTLIKGTWVAHLWFLICLIVYFVVSVFLYMLLKKNAKMNLSNKYLSLIIEKLQYKNLYILLFPLWVIGLRIVGKILPDLIWGKYFILSNYTILRFVPFFFFGFLLFNNDKVLKKYCTFYLWTVPVLIGCIVGFQNTDAFKGGIETATHLYAQYLMNWILVNYCFCIFYKFLNFKSKFFLFLSEASYTIYLFHHLIVIILGYWLIQFQIDAIFKFLMILAATSLITYLIQKKIIQRNRYMRFAFNGK